MYFDFGRRAPSDADQVSRLPSFAVIQCGKAHEAGVASSRWRRADHQRQAFFSGRTTAT